MFQFRSRAIPSDEVTFVELPWISQSKHDRLIVAHGKSSRIKLGLVPPKQG